MKRIWIKWFALISIGIFIFIGCDESYSDKTETVHYEIRGSVSPVDIRYINTEGEDTELENVDLPWQSQNFNVSEDTYISITASHHGGQTGTLTANIYVNSALVETSTSEGKDPTVFIGTDVEGSDIDQSR